jgi:hypothetical protein
LISFLGIIQEKSSEARPAAGMRADDAEGYQVDLCPVRPTDDWQS